MDVKSADLTSALATGAVDAIVATPRFVYDIRRQQGDNMVYWPAEGDEPRFDTLVATNGWLKENGRTTRSFLRALPSAEEFVARRPIQAQEIANRRLNWDDSFMADQWPKVYFSLLLDRSLIAAMESEARWAISRGLTAEREMPDFYDYVYAEGLRAVKPEAVNLGR